MLIILIYYDLQTECSAFYRKFYFKQINNQVNNQKELCSTFRYLQICMLYSIEHKLVQKRDNEIWQI